MYIGTAIGVGISAIFQKKDVDATPQPSINLEDIAWLAAEDVKTYFFIKEGGVGYDAENVTGMTYIFNI